jgi:hypothetical protein
VGGILGNSGANYTLTFTAINDDMVTRQVSLNPPGNPFKEEWNLSCGWIRSGNDFVKTGPGEADGVMRYRIAIPRPGRRLPFQRPPGQRELPGDLLRPEQPVPSRVTRAG